MKFERMEKYYSMTAERLSELQNMALAGKKPEVLDEEETAAWTWINERVQAYKNKITNIMKGVPNTDAGAIGENHV